MRDLNLIFLTRPGCHLCDEARPLVEKAARGAKVDLEEIDVDTEQELRDRYGSRIPVLLAPGDDVIAEGVISDRRRLQRAIERSARRRG